MGAFSHVFPKSFGTCLEIYLEAIWEAFGKVFVYRETPYFPLLGCFSENRTQINWRMGRSLGW